MSIQINNTQSQPTRQQAITVCLLGMAVADALGLPREGLTSLRAARMFGTGPLRHRLIFGHGMISDDTEHACMTAQALLRGGDDIAKFQHSLAWRLRWWLLGIPAGIGYGTLRAILKLWVGFPPNLSGVFSAGNGPAMRSPILGVIFASDLLQLEAAVKASTLITHKDPRAQQGALAIAAAAAYATNNHSERNGWQPALAFVQEYVTDPVLLDLLEAVREHLQRGSEPQSLAQDLGLSKGVSGYIYHTVPVALYCWLRYLGDYRTSVERSIQLGGDADTVGGIVGALAGISSGKQGISSEWLAGVCEWPRSVTWIESLAARVACRFPNNNAPELVGPLRLCWPGQLLRNILFAIIVLLHGFRRLLPPYG